MKISKYLTLKIENVIDNEEDERIITAIKQAANFSQDNLPSLWETLKKCSFNNHLVGRGGSHIWIKNKKDIDKRMAIIS